MRVLGYGRTSQDDQETSIPNQKGDVADFCDTTDVDEYGGTHELVDWYDDPDVSGKTYPAERDGFSDLIDHLNEDETIDGVVVKNFSRLGRDPIDQITIKRMLRRIHVERDIEVVSVETWQNDRRGLLEPRVEKMLESDDPKGEWSTAITFLIDGFADARVIIDASVGSGKAASQAQKNDDAWGNNPRGLVTPKVAYADSEATDRYVPVESAEDEGIQEWEDEYNKSWYEAKTPLEDVIEVLDLFARSDTDPHESYVKPTAGGVAADMGWDGESTAVRNVWDRRNEYVEIAMEHDIPVPKSLRDEVDLS